MERNRGKIKWILLAALVVLAALCLLSRVGIDGQSDGGSGSQGEGTGHTLSIEKGASYDSKDEVALYLYSYGELPPNYITKSEAKALGWRGGNVEQVAKGKCLGGDGFGNREHALPKGNGISYKECDIGTLGEDDRGPERLVYSNNGFIYYTPDHYETFELLYNEEGKVE